MVVVVREAGDPIPALATFACGALLDHTARVLCESGAVSPGSDEWQDCSAGSNERRYFSAAVPGLFVDHQVVTLRGLPWPGDRKSA